MTNIEKIKGYESCVSVFLKQNTMCDGKKMFKSRKNENIKINVCMFLKAFELKLCLVLNVHDSYKNIAVCLEDKPGSVLSKDVPG